MNADAAFTETTHAEMKPMSGMAVTAFVLTLLFCIPVLPLVGLLLGLAALGRTATSGGTMRGRPLAVTAIILGVIMTTGWGAFGYFVGVPAYKSMTMILFRGTEEPVKAAFDGDSAKAATFWWENAAPSEAETATFVSAAKARFGDFEMLFRADETQPGIGAGQPEFVLPFIFVFSEGRFDGEVAFSASQTGEMTLSGSVVGIDKIVIKDSDGTEVVWDAADAGSSTPADSSGTAPDETTGKPAAEKSAEKMDGQSLPSDP